MITKDEASDTTREEHMIKSETNVVSLLPVQRDAIRRRHAELLHLAQCLIDETNCNCDHLYGASADAIALASANIADMYNLVDVSETQDFDEPLRFWNEELAGFIAALAADLLELKHGDDPTFNFCKVHDLQCLPEARRMISEGIIESARG
jgi:hypothetical protein